MFRHFVASGWLLISGNLLVSGQDLPSIQTDRPDQTECPFTVPVNYIQLETGFSSEHTNDLTTTLSHPSTLLKFGVNEHFELRLITEFSTIRFDQRSVSGLNPVTAGFKANIAHEKGLVPTTSFIGHLTVPKLASAEFRSTYYAPAFRFTMQHTLSSRLSLGYNLGAEWDGESAEPTFIHTLTTGYSISEKTGSYIELYGFVPQQSAVDHRFDCGLNYLLTNDILLDVSGGVGLSSNSPGYYAALGFSFRINTKS